MFLLLALHLCQYMDKQLRINFKPINRMYVHVMMFDLLQAYLNDLNSRF